MRVYILAFAVAASPLLAQEISLTPRQVQVLTRNLNDPESARFRNVRMSKRDTQIVCGEINWRTAQGGFGGYRKFWIGADAETAGIDPDPSYQAWAVMAGCEASQP